MFFRASVSRYAPLLLAALLFVHCGHKGTPKPPPQKIPQRIGDLQVTQRGDRMLMSFTYPQVTISGLPIEDIVAIELWEYVLPVPEFRAEALGEEGEEGEEGESGGEGDEDGEDAGDGGEDGEKVEGGEEGEDAEEGDEDGEEIEGGEEGDEDGEEVESGEEGDEDGEEAEGSGPEDAGAEAENDEAETAAQAASATGSAGEGEPEAAGDGGAAAEDAQPAGEESSGEEPSEPLAGPQSTGPAARTGVVSDPAELDKLGSIGTTISSALGDPEEEPAGEAEAGEEDDEDEDEDEDETPVSKEALLEVDGRQFAGASRLRLSLSGEELSNAIRGDKVEITLDLGEIEPGEKEAVVYAVKSFQTLKRASSFSNLVEIIPRQTPAPPAALEAEPVENGLKLTWTFEGEEPHGFRIYRRDPDQLSFGLPLGTREGDERQFLDSGAAFGGDYVYAVTAVVNPVPLVESELSEELEAALIDTFPPAAPSDLVVFAEVGTARLLWSASEAGDLDGYFIYRREAAGEFKRLNDKPHRRTDYNDEQAASGRRYTYRVEAVDLSGNVSEPSEEVETRIP